jgi:hypothetical protein
MTALSGWDVAAEAEDSARVIARRMSRMMCVLELRYRDGVEFSQIWMVQILLSFPRSRRKTFHPSQHRYRTLPSRNI